MILKTFEQGYKETLKTQLGSYFTDIIVSNDITIKPFEVNPDSIFAIIKSGGANKESVSDLTDFPLNICFLCGLNKLQDTLLNVNRFIEEHNGLFETLTINDTSNTSKTYTYQIFWSTPITSDETIDIRADNGKLIKKVTACNILGKVKFASDVEIAPCTFKIKVNNSTVVTIDKLVSYDITDQPTFKPYMLFNYTKPFNVKVADNKVYTINTLKTSSLMTNLINASISSLHLKVDYDDYITISTYQFYEIYENRIPIIRIVLTVGNNSDTANSDIIEL